MDDSPDPLGWLKSGRLIAGLGFFGIVLFGALALAALDSQNRAGSIVYFVFTIMSAINLVTGLRTIRSKRT